MRVALLLLTIVACGPGLRGADVNSQPVPLCHYEWFILQLS